MNKANSSSGQIRPHIVMTLFGRCGAFFVHSLFDGHPLLSSIPGIAPEYILNKALSNPELVPTSTYDLAVWATENIDFQFNNPVHRQRYGFDHMGDNADEALSIDTHIFYRHVLTALAKREGMAILPRLNEAMHDAFDLTQYGTTRPQIFFHTHTKSRVFACKFLSEIPYYRLFVLLREPVENVESCVTHTISTIPNQRDHLPFFYKVVKEMLYRQHNSSGMLGHDSVAVRLEDIKAQPEVTLRALCEALALPFDPALLHSSFMSKAYTSVPTVRNPQIKGFDDPASAPQGYRLSQKDRAFFATLFSGIRHWAGYGAHETLDEKEMRAIIDGSLLDVEVDIAASEGITKEALQGDENVIAFRQFLAEIPNIFNGPTTKITSRLIARA